MPKDIIAVFDLEAVTDERLKPKDMPADKFRPPIMHIPITVSILIAKRQKSEAGHIIHPAKLVTLLGDEPEILQRFSALLDKHRPQLVSYNGRGYDVPVLTQRAMINRIPMSAYFQLGDKWNSYKQRYSQDWHLDLMDAMSNYRAAPVTSLGIAATAVGLPGKYGPSGADVGEMFRAGKLCEIADYCETDVLNTYGLMLRWLHTTGELTEQGFTESAQRFYAFLASEGDKKTHLAEFGSRVDWDFFSGQAVNSDVFEAVSEPKILAYGG